MQVLIQMKSTTLLAAYFVLHLSFKAVRSDEVYIVLNSTAMCTNFVGVECLELKDCINNSSQYILSNTTFKFMPGIHHIEVGSLLFENIHEVELLGSSDFKMFTIAEKVNEYGFDPSSLDANINYIESSSHIVCDYSQSGFVFANVINLKITNLTIVNCGLYSSMTSVIASVHMVNVSNLLMDGVSILNSTGYGLWGVNVLGHSQLRQSSFVGNNQYVKDLLHKKIINGFSKNNAEMFQNTITVYENNGSLDCNSHSGGNAVFYYQDSSPANPKSTHTLSILSCLFSLAVDLSYALQDQITQQCGYMNGTGLSVIMNQIGSYYLSIEITNTTSYRNHANFGANIFFRILDTKFSNITLDHVSSLYAIGFAGGLYASNEQHESSTCIQFTITESTFKYNFSPNSYIPPVYISSILYVLNVYITNSTFHQSAIYIHGNFYFVYDTCSFEVSDITIAATLHVDFNNCKFVYSSLSNTGTGIDMFNILYNYCSFEKSSITASALTITINSCYLVYSRLNAVDSSVFLIGNVQFAQNVFNYNGGAISLYASTATFKQSSNITFINNTAVNGGSIYMDESSFLIFQSPNFQANFINNTAKLAGGAIYAKTLSSSYISQSSGKCFFRTLMHEPDLSKNVYLCFDQNSAADAGSVLFGGSIENCPSWTFNHFQIIPNSRSSSSLISSEPIYICNCVYGKAFDSSKALNLTQGINLSALQLKTIPSCQLSSLINSSVYPGQKLMVPFITYGQAYGSASTLVLVYSNDSEIKFISAIRSNPTCKIYDIHWNLTNTTLYLGTSTAFNNGLSYINNIRISITVLPCPTGFVLDNATSSCVCASLLKKYKLTCSIENQTIQAIGNKWIGFTSNNVLGILDQCPFNYCKTTGIINVTDLDNQCAFSRQGVLCGKCQGGLSMTFGTSQCKNCSNYYLLLIIPFALMGVVLVGLLFLLNLTVANGSLNGLIFYANIIKINDKIFFPTNYASSYSIIFYTFIAWINLDFGIETCFYNGMDSYAKTWLQFAFPIYIYGLVGIIILAGRYSTTISKLCRFNAVSVLATLIQLSYSKLLSTIITIFSSASIDTDYNTAPSIWLYDGNVLFLGSRHIPLFILGLLITSLFIIPYTIALLFIPCLQSRSHWKFLQWVNILKQFLDYHASPYKDHFRFWGGVLLVVRLPLYLISAFAYSVNVKLLGIVIFMFIYLLLFRWLSAYKRWYHTTLEMFFHLNLVTLAIAHLFEPTSISSLPVNIILTIGVGSSFLSFAILITISVGVKMVKIWKDDQNPQTAVPVSSVEIYGNDCDNINEDNGEYTRLSFAISN